jgi:hypothetical protein
MLKIFLSVIYKLRNKLEYSSVAILSSLVAVAVKAGTYPGEALFRSYSTLGLARGFTQKY